MPEAAPLKIGLIREGKTPPDSRVVFTPEQAARVARRPGIDLTVQRSPGRCYPDDAYAAAGVTLVDDVADRDVLIGVKEVPIEQLLAGKTYFFFSHTHKEQAYNRDLLKAVLDRRIRLIDYELLTDGEGGKRLIAFGRFAGMVGAHHALRAWGLRTGAYELPQMRTFHDYAAAREAYAATEWGDVRIVVTGTGRVGRGAAEVLRDAGLERLTPAQFRQRDRGRGGAVFTVLSAGDYVRHATRKGPVVKQDFYRHPEDYVTAFAPYAAAADVLIHGIFWDNRAPALFAPAEVRPGTDAWSVRVVADVTCDIAPVTSVPLTLKASTIAEPYFGVEVRGGEAREVDGDPFAAPVTMMTVDNLPNELPRDASKAFGAMFIERILPELLRDDSEILARATIADRGRLNEPYRYLEDFVNA